ncbi:Aspartate beta-hydroxylase domain-containing protein 2 [Nymphon striatum]|nr:Aspartate beta-hydroxylase domain-containing protein 2 [Nymphon striatum]
MEFNHFSCCDQFEMLINLSGYASAIYLFFGVIFSATVIYILQKINNLYKQNYARDKIFYSTCSSDHCFRCAMDENKQHLIKRKLKHVCNSMPVENISKLKRITSSIRSISSSDTETPDYCFYLKNLPTEPWFGGNLDLQLCLENVENCFEIICKETFSSFLTLPDKNWVTNTTHSGTWKILYLMNQGAPVAENIQHFTRTISILKSSLKCYFMENCVFGNVGISVVQPDTSIAPHKGPTNCRLRCHLGLEIPTGNDCYIIVENQRKLWTTGKCTLFDDSFRHSVVNYSSQKRIVLLFDLWHQNLNDVEIEVLQKAFSR